MIQAQTAPEPTSSGIVPHVANAFGQVIWVQLEPEKGRVLGFQVKFRTKA